MKTHNLLIFHCLACGAIIHCELDQDVPVCCGEPMIKAAAETVANECQISEGVSVQALPSTDRVPQKPR